MTLSLRQQQQEHSVLQSVVYPDHLIGGILGDAGIGIWHIEMNSDTISLCPTASSFFSSNGGMISIFNILRQILLPDARLLLQAINKACRKKESLCADVRLYSTSGNQTKWLRISGRYSRIKGKEALRGIVTDISDEKIEEQRKDDYVALLNHELKSPLTTIKLYIQMVTKQAKLTKGSQLPEILEKAEMQVGVMSRMVDNFLTTSAVSNGSLQIVAEPFEILKLLHETVTEMGMVYPQRRFDICFSSDVMVFADREKIAQVLINYLSNAVKYSRSAGMITVKCKVAHQQVQISVEDQGNGITDEDQSKIFNRFYRTNPEGVKGFGLGLYLVKEIIEAHNGKVWLESTVGCGSIFHFSLPVTGTQ